MFELDRVVDDEDESINYHEERDESGLGGVGDE